MIRKLARWWRLKRNPVLRLLYLADGLRDSDLRKFSEELRHLMASRFERGWW